MAANPPVQKRSSEGLSYEDLFFSALARQHRPSPRDGDGEQEYPGRSKDAGRGGRQGPVGDAGGEARAEHGAAKASSSPFPARSWKGGSQEGSANFLLCFGFLLSFSAISSLSVRKEKSRLVFSSWVYVNPSHFVSVSIYYFFSSTCLEFLLPFLTLGVGYSIHFHPFIFDLWGNKWHINFQQIFYAEIALLAFCNSTKFLFWWLFWSFNFCYFSNFTEM